MVTITTETTPKTKQNKQKNPIQTKRTKPQWCHSSAIQHYSCMSIDHQQGLFSSVCHRIAHLTVPKKLTILALQLRWTVTIQLCIVHGPYIQFSSLGGCYSILSYSMLCPSTAGSSPLPESSIFLCPLLSLSILLPFGPPCHLSNNILAFPLISYTLYLGSCTSREMSHSQRNFFFHDT